MKSTGIVRKVDELGRVVIPIELRRTMNIKEGDPLEIFTEDERIIFKKYVPNMACQITNEVSPDNLVLANGKLVLSRKAAKSVVQEIERYMGEDIKP
ncbi:AbrB/MazE/SpoVT family DNA-binding domain-containing protein [Sporolactobacillus terrae]|uniref:AbrB/MazE/SpoVT family DNA-binding domain-containing protein n=1 Tax=Sporolactobacillus terrae TaxID=269673 RepID=A0A410D7B4_9BACL|nr:AbrB/MazE/SpoVT family DNA-binding domain-containing protein [Sporolactobacillus terrae]QAA21980.1 AbrB/MazE/SpoVT family DNA-binding domain-containing protein [Sporolactobacillus terrae]QAA24953.1 AbrB/MazE/SpoVT family DNA-binding domain-containing protein [Sporolactobacillus terrae]UAK16775.1 AbrB/MazE/SpoVT family DNA-binding domain-containing protein [Sporolactobacillus terrae]BBN98257.1 transition state regulatory protein AbrB [Sporolactobacillus terrae]